MGISDSGNFSYPIGISRFREFILPLYNFWLGNFSFREFIIQGISPPSGQGIYHSGNLSYHYMNFWFREFLLTLIWIYLSGNFSSLQSGIYHPIWIYHSGNLSFREFLIPYTNLSFREFIFQGIYLSGNLSFREFIFQGIYLSRNLSFREFLIPSGREFILAF